MIQKILTHFASRLDECLCREFPRPEGVAEVGFIGNRADEQPCKLIVSLINIEREMAGGISACVRRDEASYVRCYPSLLLNLDLMLAVVYDDKRYAESLSVLSAALNFIQSSPNFEFEGKVYSIEIVTLSAQDINKIWSTLGGQYFPSVMCKLRRLVIDSNESAGSGRLVTAPPHVSSKV